MPEWMWVVLFVGGIWYVFHRRARNEAQWEARHAKYMAEEKQRWAAYEAKIATLDPVSDRALLDEMERAFFLELELAEIEHYGRKVSARDFLGGDDHWGGAGTQ